MFQKNPSATPSADNDTIIAALVKVEGELASQGNIIIEGEVHGNIRTEHHLRVGEAAKIYANIKADSSYIAGEVHGNIKIKNDLELTPTAKVIGDIETKTITVARGGIVHGKCSMLAEEKVKESKQTVEPKN